jgi:very-short-patch-repair endonuclease
MKSPYQEHLDEIALRTLELCQKILRKSHTQKLFYGQTALQLLGIELPLGIEENTQTAHVCVPDVNKVSKMKNVKYHQWSCRFDPIESDSFSGVVCVYPLDAWMQCTSRLSSDEAIVLAENIMRVDSDILPSDFDSCLNTQFRGCRRCSEAVPLIRQNTDSSQETRLRLKLCEAGLPEPSINYTPQGLLWGKDFPMRFDLAYEKQRILIEYDGLHHITPEQRNNDNEKRSQAQAAGWCVLVIDSRNFKDAVQLVRDTMKMKSAPFY